MPTATHTAPSSDEVRSTRENAITLPAATRKPASGTSKGAIIRRRTRWFVSASPVAWSDQASTIHSTSTATSRNAPTMNMTLLITRPSTTRAAPKAPTSGEYDG